MSARLYRLLFWVGAIAALLYLLGQLQGVVMPFAVSFVIAYLLGPLVDRLQSWGVRRSLAAAAVLLVFLLAVSLVLVLIVPLVEAQIVRLIDRLPSLVTALQGEFGRWMEALQEHVPQQEVAKLRDLVGSWFGDVVTWIAGLFQRMITGGFAILNILSLVIVTPVVAFFLMRDWPRIVAQVDSLVPRNAVPTVREQARIIDDTLAGFVHGQAVVCLILALYYAVALSVAGIESALAVGLLIGVLAIVPVVGVAIGFALSIGLAALQYGTWTAVVVVCGIFLFGQTVEANILTPKLVGDRIHLHPVWVIFALLAGGQLYGFTGVLVSVPAAAVIGVLVRFAIERYRRSELYEARPNEPVRRIAPFE